jgi:hypothetical protein
LIRGLPRPSTRFGAPKGRNVRTITKSHLFAIGCVQGTPDQSVILQHDNVDIWDNPRIKSGDNHDAGRAAREYVYNRVDKENTNPTGRQEIVRFSENFVKN